jgi:hypothetical protein
MLSLGEGDMTGAGEHRRQFETKLYSLDLLGSLDRAAILERHELPAAVG